MTPCDPILLVQWDLSIWLWLPWGQHFQSMCLTVRVLTSTTKDGRLLMSDNSGNCNLSSDSCCCVLRITSRRARTYTTKTEHMSMLFLCQVHVHILTDWEYVMKFDHLCDKSQIYKCVLHALSEKLQHENFLTYGTCTYIRHHVYNY